MLILKIAIVTYLLTGLCLCYKYVLDEGHTMTAIETMLNFLIVPVIWGPIMIWSICKYGGDHES